MGLLNIFKKRKQVEKKVEKKPGKKIIEKKKEREVAKEPYFAPIEGIKPKIEKETEKIKKTGVAGTKKKKEVSKIVYPVRDSEGKRKAQKRQISDRAYRVLGSPHISEKATDLNEKNKYVFKIRPGANKIEVKKAIKDIYEVDAVDVKIINVHRKKRRLGKQIGWRKGYKKAIVKVKKGQKIELLSR